MSQVHPLFPFQWNILGFMDIILFYVPPRYIDAWSHLILDFIHFLFPFKFILDAPLSNISAGDPDIGLLY